jgi:hypothetical protein
MLVSSIIKSKVEKENSPPIPKKHNDEFGKRNNEFKGHHVGNYTTLRNGFQQIE